mmetsp:Transcript_58704/g.65686  ORF Transcript_58704/g.65686 Transcript_58704/m.65686 type:complete len:198 (-) Transcript_58704:112-705(-)
MKQIFFAIAASIFFYSVTCGSSNLHFLASGFHPQNNSKGSTLQQQKQWRKRTLCTSIVNSENKSHDGGVVNDEQQQNEQPFTLKERNPYDVHVYYDGEDERKEAMNFRRKLQEQFIWMRFYTPKERPIGPHPLPMWEADFGGYENRYKWTNVRDYVEKEHGRLSVLIHPHSNDGDYADHTKNAFWAGKILDLRIQGW